MTLTLTPPTVFCVGCSALVVSATTSTGKIVRLDEQLLGPLELAEAYPGAPPMAVEATGESGVRRYDVHRCKYARSRRLSAIAPSTIAPLAAIAEVNV